jgi:His/Glu/Gln/Arg/opine family amino acid ABC transporter permease subunit
VLFAVLVFRAPILAPLVIALIDLMRCMPFILFCYLIYYVLPYGGILTGNLTAGVPALTLYNAAYVAELLRGAWQALPRDTIEAGTAFGFHGWRLVWRIVLPPGRAERGADARQSGDPDHQGQRLSRDHHLAGTHLRRQRDPGDPLRAVRRVPVRRAVLLVAVPWRRGRRARRAWPRRVVPARGSWAER